VLALLGIAFHCLGIRPGFAIYEKFRFREESRFILGAKWAA
jgi:hypothetical protein